MKKNLLKSTIVILILIITGFFLRSIGLTELMAGETGSGGSGKHLTFHTADGLILHAWQADADDDTLPGLALLLPMMSMTHTSYDLFADKLHRIGYATISFDMRGHGLSTEVRGKQVSYSSMSNNDFPLMPTDVESLFLDFKKKHPRDYNYGRVVIIGASIGANTAALLLDRSWVQRAVLLSPGRDYRGLQIEKIMASDPAALTRPIYIAVSIDDTYSAESSLWLFDRYTGPKVLKKYPGQDHGTNILLNIKGADQELLDWLKK